MANWNVLKAAVANIIKANNNQEITGQLLQNVLNNIITNVGENATFAGITTLDTNPGAPDGPVFYLATTAGIYANFNGIEVLEGEAVILLWNNGTWSKKATGFATQEKLSELNSEVEKTVESTYIFSNGGANNASNAFKVRTCGIDVRGKEKIVFTTDRPLSENSHYEYDCFFVKESSAIGKIFSSNSNPLNFTGVGSREYVQQNELVLVPNEASAVVIGIYEIPNNGKEGDIILRTADFKGYRIGYSINTANSEMPSVYKSIDDLKLKDEEHDKKISNITASYSPQLRNGTALNSGNAFAVRTNEFIPVSIGDRVRAMFVGKTLSQDEEFRYGFTGCKVTNKFTDIGSDRTEGVSYDSGYSDSYEVTKEETIGIIVDAVIYNKKTNTYTSLQPYTEYDNNPLRVDIITRAIAEYSESYTKEYVNKTSKAISENVLGIERTLSTIGNGSCQNSGNANAVHTTTFIPAKKGDVFRVELNKELIEGHYLKWWMGGSKSSTIFTDLSSRGVLTESIGTESLINTYEIKNEETIGFHACVFEYDSDGNYVPLRKADANLFGISVLYNRKDSIAEDVSKNKAKTKELETRIHLMENKLVLASNFKNGGSGNGSNGYKVRTLALDVRDRASITLTTDRPLSGDTHYEYECVFAKEEEAIGQFFASNENPYKFTLAQRSYIKEGQLVNAEGYSAVVVAVYEIPNEGKEGDIVLRTTDFNGYGIGYSYDTIDEELKETKERVSLVEEKLEGFIKEDAYGRNRHKSIALGAACRQRKSSNTSKDFQIIEVTDSHDDKIAVNNAVTMTNGFRTVDTIIHCGDMAGDYMTPITSMSSFINSMKESVKPWYNVIGNHEAGTYNMVGYVPSIQHMYNTLIAPIVEAGHLNEGEYQVGKCHYFHDFAEYKIRLICVNEYDGDLAFDNEYWEAIAYDSSVAAFGFNTQYNVGDKVRIPNYTEYCFKCIKSAVTGSSIYGLSGQEPRYRVRPGSRMISQEQAQWFLDTMLNTPEGYSIIIAMHNPFSDNAVVDLTKKFSEKINVVASSQAQNSMENDFFADIVNAYIKGIAYSDYIAFKGSASYRNIQTNSEGKAYAYYLSADFSAKNNNTKFMCYIGGHVHNDLIWNHLTYKDQWQVTPVCAVTSYHQSPRSDIRRSNIDGLDYDSITSISFDTANRAISLVKIGVDVTENMEYRDFEKITL